MSTSDVLAALAANLTTNSSAPAPAPTPDVTEDVVEQYSFNTGLMVLLMVLWSAIGHQIASRTKYLGEWSAACILGLLTGLVILIMQRYMSADVVHQLLTFNPADFFTYLLPPIIFYAGLSVKKKQFFRNFATIASFGIFGTYIAFALIALVLYGLAQLPNVLDLSDSLALGVIFAATDSVAVLQVLRPDRAPLLYSLVFGEGVINDATAVALLRAVQELGSSEKNLHASLVITVLTKFLYLFAASMFLGLAFGLGTSFLMKRFKSNSVPQEVALIGMLGYLSYLCGELAGLSGIVTLFCCAVAISHYALHNISAPARVTLVRSCQTLSYVSEGAIFIYVGMDTLDPLKWKNTYFGETVWLFCVLLLLTMLGRAAFVFPFSMLHNWCSRQEEQLSFKEMIVIWWAGLIRGAVSVALVYYYFDPKGQSEDSHRATLIATTLVVVMFSITVFGAITKPLLDLTLRGSSRGGLTVEGNASNLAELIPHHNHSSLDGLSPVDVLRPSNDRGPAYAAVGVAQETVFPLEGSGLRRSAWATSYDSLPSSAALDDGLDPSHAALDRNHRNDSSSGGIGTFQPPPLTPPKAPWPDSARQKEDASQKRASTGTGGHMNGGSGAHVQARPAEVASASGGIEMVEGSYVTGAGGERSTNPFGFDSFGRQVAGAPQRQRPPLHHTGQPQRPPGTRWQGGEGARQPPQPPTASLLGDAGEPSGASSGSSTPVSRGRASRSAPASQSGRAAQSPFGWEAAQGSSNGERRPSDNGPGESTPSAAFGWTGLDERSSSGQRPAGRINRWWTTFDAAYMQPVFGGPSHGGAGGSSTVGTDADPLLPVQTSAPRSGGHDLV
ncbi:g7026 [Coccomyxa elongata]